MPEIPAVTLNQLTSLVAAAREAQAELAEAQAVLKEKETALKRLIEEDIPTLMTDQLGIRKLTMDDGQQVEVKDDVQASIPKEYESAAFAWLEENGYGSLIKATVSVEFGREEISEAHRLMMTLDQNGFLPVLKQSVHWQTLAAWLREMLRDARDIPLELFGARPLKKATIKLPRAR